MSTLVSVTGRQEERLLRALSKEVPSHLQSKLLVWLLDRNGKEDIGSTLHSRVDPRIRAILFGLQTPEKCRAIQYAPSLLHALLGESAT
jgi:hypothetical protein